MALTLQQQRISASAKYWKWFTEWWNRDYSWGGLKYKQIDAGDLIDTGEYEKVSLQSEWEDCEHELIKFAGRKWTLLHLPEHDLEGNLSSKSPLLRESLGYNNRFLETVRSRIFRHRNDAERSRRSSRLWFEGIWFPSSKIDERFFDEEISELESIKDNNNCSTLFLYASNTNKTNDCDHHVCGDFRWVHFSKNMEFKDVVFLSSDFSNAMFDAASFCQCKFKKQSYFRKSNFILPCEFTHTEFSGSVFFDGAEFTEPDHMYENPSKIFLLTDDLLSEMRGYTFDTCHFNRSAYFRDIEFNKAVNFGNCKFSGVALFSGSEFHQAGAFFNNIFQLPPKEMLDSQLKVYERAFLVLKNICFSSGDKQQAYYFFRLEKLTRRYRWNVREVVAQVEVRTSDSTSFYDWLLLHLYGSLSRFGTSVSAPLIWLLLMWLMVGQSIQLLNPNRGSLCFEIWSTGCQFFHNGMQLSGQNAFPPISNTIVRQVQGDITIFDVFGAGASVVVLFLTLQLIISSALVFLAGLAVRRYLEFK